MNPGAAFADTAVLSFMAAAAIQALRLLRQGAAPDPVSRWMPLAASNPTASSTPRSSSAIRSSRPERWFSGPSGPSAPGAVGGAGIRRIPEPWRPG